MSSRIPTEEIEFAVARLVEMSPDLRGAAIAASDGEVLASSGEDRAWQSASARLWEAADRSGGRPARSLHVGIESGEVFGCRDGELVATAVTERFALASLVLVDMRSVLRDLQRFGSVRRTGARVSESEFVPGSHPDQAGR